MVLFRAGCRVKKWKGPSEVNATYKLKFLLIWIFFSCKISIFGLILLGCSEIRCLFNALTTVSTPLHQNSKSGPGLIGGSKIKCFVYILVGTAWDKIRIRVWKVHLSCFPHSRPVLVSSRSSLRHIGKSVQSQRKRECLECLASLLTILTRECECLYSCVLRLVHISPKVSTSTQDKNVNQALQNSDYHTVSQRDPQMYVMSLKQQASKRSLKLVCNKSVRHAFEKTHRTFGTQNFFSDQNTFPSCKKIFLIFGNAPSPVIRHITMSRRC